MPGKHCVSPGELHRTLVSIRDAERTGCKFYFMLSSLMRQHIWNFVLQCAATRPRDTIVITSTTAISRNQEKCHYSISNSNFANSAVSSRILKIKLQ